MNKSFLFSLTFFDQQKKVTKKLALTDFRAVLHSTYRELIQTPLYRSWYRVRHELTLFPSSLAHHLKSLKGLEGLMREDTLLLVENILVFSVLSIALYFISS